MNERTTAIAIMGPTASGKSSVAEGLAAQLGCRIINADAFQVYRGLDIGTSKPVERENYELIDILEPNEQFSAGKFVELAMPLCSSRPCVVCGGTGLYVRALFDEYSEMSASEPGLREKLRSLTLEELGQNYSTESFDEQTISNPVRLLRAIEKSEEKSAPPRQPWTAKRIKFGLNIERETLLERIEKRVHTMVQNGWEAEVERLLANGAQPGWPAFRAIGYREMIACVQGTMSLVEVIEKTILRTRQYAKRQMTWLRKEPGLRWVEATASTSEITSQILSLIGEELSENGEVN